MTTFPLQRTSSAALRTPPQACLSHGLWALVHEKEEHNCNDDKEDDDEVPEQLVVDDNGVDKVESKEPEEEAIDPAGQLRMILMFVKKISLMTRLTCSSSREVAV